MTRMGEIVSEEVLDWARDLAAIHRLLAGERLEGAAATGLVISPSFGASRARGSGLPLRKAPR
jgi:hypothetical protein